MTENTEKVEEKETTQVQAAAEEQPVVEEAKAEEAAPVEAAGEEKEESSEQAPAAEVNPLERSLEFTVSAEACDKAFEKELRQRAKKAKFHGFRPGKAPLNMVLSAYGQEIQNKVFNDVVYPAMLKTMDESGLEIVSTPSLEQLQSDDQAVLKYKITFEIAPEVVLPNLKEIKLSKYECTVTDEELAKTIEMMRTQRATFDTVERGAEDTDKVKIDFVGKLNGEVFQGGEAKGYSFILGNNQMLPEFETAIHGMKAGDEKTFPLTFPTQYPAPELAGKEVTFTVNCLEVGQMKKPEFNDEFAKGFGVESVEKLKEDIKANLDREVANRVRRLNNFEVFQKLSAATEFPLPTEVVQKTRQQMISDNLGLDAEKRANFNINDYPKEVFLDQARNTAKLSYILGAILKAGDIKLSADKVKELAEQIAASYEDPEEVVKWYLDDASRRQELSGIVLENSAVDWVLEQADTTPESVDFVKLMAQ